MPSDDPTFTRWRSVAQPLSPMDPIVPDGPRLEEGKLPPRLVLLLLEQTVADPDRLSGPIRFETQEAADEYLKINHNITAYLVVPKPDV